MQTLESRAKQFASQAHEGAGQRRKYTQQPYIIHPAAVVEWVRRVNQDEILLAAAWLHDTVEDTGTSLAEIEQHFGQPVADLVAMLTLPARPPGASRIEKQQAALQHMANASPSAKTIKLADIIDNTCSIIPFDAEFARYYLVEKQLQLEVLREGDPWLWQQAEDIILRGMQTLQQPPHRISGEWFDKTTSRYQQAIVSNRL